MKMIDLSRHNGQIYKVLSGVDFGEEVRKKLDLDRLDTQPDLVVFSIPECVYSLNSSFFSGLFQKSIKRLKEQGFREKYQFECSPVIRKNIEDGIFNIVNTLNLLG